MLSLCARRYRSIWVIHIHGQEPCPRIISFFVLLNLLACHTMFHCLHPSHLLTVHTMNICVHFGSGMEKIVFVRIPEKHIQVTVRCFAR